MIIGFPMETAADRRQTYEFLAYLRRKYRNFSFNLNIFALDVSSPMFADWDSYGISSIAFPCAPRYFLGNLVRWNCAEEPFVETALREEQERVMRELLYPWLPKDALISPHVLYRLLETTRNTLFRSMGEQEPPDQFCLSDYAVPLDVPKESRVRKYYSLKFQTCLALSQGLENFFSFAAGPHTRKELLRVLESQNRVTSASAEKFLTVLLESGILEPAATAKERDFA